MTGAWIACIAAAYLIGSIPFGVIIGRIKGIDIREHGSKNIGATNVGRVLGKKFGLVCFVLDMLKGAVPVLAAGAWNHTLGRDASELTALQMWLWFAVACAAVTGHMFSIFLGFRGGKGVATGCGAMLAMWPLLTFPALGSLVVWYVTLRLFRFVSLASMLAAASLPLGYLLAQIPPDALEQPASHTIDRLIHASPLFIGTLIIAALVIYQHRGNIRRLRRGEEPQIGSHR